MYCISDNDEFDGRNAKKKEPLIISSHSQTIGGYLEVHVDRAHSVMNGKTYLDKTLQNLALLTFRYSIVKVKFK